jgi:hypothetical protein
MKRGRWLVVVGGAAALLAGCLRAPAPAPAGADRPAPPTEGTDAHGRTFRLSDYRGRVVLLEFWRLG